MSPNRSCSIIQVPRRRGSPVGLDTANVNNMFLAKLSWGHVFISVHTVWKLLWDTSERSERTRHGCCLLCTVASEITLPKQLSLCHGGSPYLQQPIQSNFQERVNKGSFFNFGQTIPLTDQANGTDATEIHPGHWIAVRFRRAIDLCGYKTN